ncbi:hypothetical protein RHCRD62_10367 [Rhodococcus sp. RD6.2]|nr:hypothetical protein RHCRD62_10367 [Rhodococcus sp. RD6.2]
MIGGSRSRHPNRYLPSDSHHSQTEGLKSKPILNCVVIQMLPYILYPRFGVSRDFHRRSRRIRIRSTVVTARSRP